MGNMGNVKRGLPLKDRSEMSNAIREFRIASGWTQGVAGKAIGMSGPTLAILESIPKYKSNVITERQYHKLKEAGLDLAEKVKDLKITSAKRGKAPKITEADLTVRVQPDKFMSIMGKALNLVTRAKDSLMEKVGQYDTGIVKLEKQAQDLLEQAEAIKLKKQRLLEKIHKAELGIDNINNSITQKETPEG